MAKYKFSKCTPKCKNILTSMYIRKIGRANVKGADGFIGEIYLPQKRVCSVLLK